MLPVAPKDSLAEVEGGAFVRTASGIRNFVSASGPYPPAAGRYVLFISWACPWACRCAAVRALKGLEGAIALAVVAPVWRETRPAADGHRGWVFDPASEPDATADPVFGAATLRDVYDRAAEHGSPRVAKFTVPLLLDRETRTIVNNESSEIMRMLNAEFNAFASRPHVDLYPPHLAAAIDAVNERVYGAINDGVYRCGVATTQAAYDAAEAALFAALAWADELLGRSRFLCGATLTEADIRLAVTLFRFDAVYVVHFKTARALVREMPHLHGFMLDVAQQPGVRGTINVDDIKRHYFLSHPTLNPRGIIPRTADEDWAAPHGRGERAFPVT